MLEVRNIKKFDTKIWVLRCSLHLHDGVLCQVHGSIFVLDASNDLRMLEVANEFKKVVKDAYLNGKPMLVVANKRDLSFDLPTTNAFLGVLGPINSTYQAFIECNCSLLVICTYIMTLNQALKF